MYTALHDLLMHENTIQCSASIRSSKPCVLLMMFFLFFFWIIQSLCKVIPHAGNFSLGYDNVSINNNTIHCLISDEPNLSVSGSIFHYPVVRFFSVIQF